MLRSLRRSRSVSSTIVVTGEELAATGESNLFNALAGKDSRVYGGNEG